MARGAVQTGSLPIVCRFTFAPIMAIRPCRECGRPVSTEAPSCPGCGVPNPTEHPLPVARPSPAKPAYPIRPEIIAIVTLAVVGAVLYTFASAPIRPTPQPSADSTRRVRDSIRAYALAGAAGVASIDSVLWAERIIHARRYAIPHDSLHRRALRAVFDSVERLTRTGSPDAAESYLSAAAHDPMTRSDSQRVKQLHERATTAATAARAKAREENVLANTPDRCVPSRVKVQSVIRRHGEWSDTDLALVACRRIRLGFTGDQVIASWGRPNTINRTTYSFGVHEQWVYGEYGGSYVYFEDGKVTTIQN